MRTRICKGCGKPFICPTGSDLYLCPECHKKAKLSSVYRERVCPACGRKFWGYPKSKYCQECQKDRDREANRRSRQKYCPDCSESAAAENIRKAKREYYAENRDRVAAHKKAMRDTEYVCVICGKRFRSDTPRVTCSEECDRERRRLKQNSADIRRGQRKMPAEERCVHKNPQSGIKGVTWCRGKWQAIWKTHYIGIYATTEEAAAAIERYKNEGV